MSRRLKEDQLALITGVGLGLTLTIQITTLSASDFGDIYSQIITASRFFALTGSYLSIVGLLLIARISWIENVLGQDRLVTWHQVVFHIPVTGAKNRVKHVGSNIVFFNSANNKQVQLKNPIINLAKGTVSAVIPQGSGEATTVLQITNASTLNPVVTNDRQVSLKTTAYKGAALSLAPGIGAALSSLLELPAGSIPENLAFATADVSLYSSLKAQR